MNTNNNIVMNRNSNRIDFFFLYQKKYLEKHEKTLAIEEKEFQKKIAAIKKVKISSQLNDINTKISKRHKTFTGFCVRVLTAVPFLRWITKLFKSLIIEANKQSHLKKEKEPITTSLQKVETEIKQITDEQQKINAERDIIIKEMSKHYREIDGKTTELMYYICGNKNEYEQLPTFKFDPFSGLNKVSQKMTHSVMKGVAQDRREFIIIKRADNKGISICMQSIPYGKNNSWSIYRYNSYNNHSIYPNEVYFESMLVNSGRIEVDNLKKIKNLFDLAVSQ